MPVYPCVYREHISSRNNGRVVTGLSLCIQGTQPAHLLPAQSVRFIPVYTGNTPHIYRYIRQLTVYPCVYREHL